MNFVPTPIMPPALKDLFSTKFKNSQRKKTMAVFRNNEQYILSHAKLNMRLPANIPPKSWELTIGINAETMKQIAYVTIFSNPKIDEVMIILQEPIEEFPSETLIAQAILLLC